MTSEGTSALVVTTPAARDYLAQSSSTGLLPQLIDVLEALTEGSAALSLRVRAIRLGSWHESDPLPEDVPLQIRPGSALSGSADNAGHGPEGRADRVAGEDGSTADAAGDGEHPDHQDEVALDANRPADRDVEVDNAVISEPHTSEMQTTRLRDGNGGNGRGAASFAGTVDPPESTVVTDSIPLPATSANHVAPLVIPDAPGAEATNADRASDSSITTASSAAVFGSERPDETARTSLTRDYNFFDELDAKLAKLQEPLDGSEDR
jgi:hypothetical protein